jgi:hypothetical protein
MAEADLEAAGAAIRALSLDLPTPVTLLRDRNRRRKTRRWGLGVGALVVVLITAGIVVSLRPERSRVVTTSPAATIPLVRLPPVSHPSRWQPIDYGLLRLWLPPGWQAVSGPTGCTTRSYDNLMTLEPSIQGCGSKVTTYLSLRRSTKPAPVTWPTSSLNGVTVRYHHVGRRIMYVVPRLQVTITATGAEAVAVARTVGPSSLDAVLAMNGPVKTPTSWKSVRFDGFEVRVPRNWKTARVTADCGGLFFAAKNPVAYTGKALYDASCAVVLPTYLLRPGNGVWLEQVANEARRSVAYRLEFHHLGVIVDPATSSLGGQVGVPIVNITAVAGTHTLSAQLGLGTDPTTAEQVLSTLRYVGVGSS